VSRAPFCCFNLFVISNPPPSSNPLSDVIVVDVVWRQSKREGKGGERGGADVEDGESETLSVLRVVVEHADFAGKKTRAERSSDPSRLWVVVDDGLFCLPQHALGLVKELLGKDLAALLASRELAQTLLEARDATEPETKHQDNNKRKKRKKKHKSFGFDSLHPFHPILKERRRDDPSFLLFGSSHPRPH